MIGRLREVVGPTELAIIIFHPIIAILVIGWMVKQHRWRQQGKLLKGDERKAAVTSHERDGERLYILAWLVVASGFIANALHRMRTENLTLPSALLPTGAGGLHAGGGIIGLVLITILWQ